ncbi:ribonuclease Z [Hahella sp. NBU794]|uniref:ribonuclease Z n=1 Tax=Hahella sp. NBU794 TaxID=3422590 RepID=UPI003D6F88F8
MELTFLGTSSGVPTKSRNVSAVCVKMTETKDWWLVDCGEGTQHRLLHCRHTLKQLRGVCITHVHGDHCYGLPGLLASASMSGRTEPLTVIGPAPLQTFLQAMIETTQLRFTYELRFVDVETLLHSDFVDADFQLRAHALSHRVPSYAYSFTERHVEAKLDVARLQANGVPPGPIWGRLQKGESVTLDNGAVIHGADYLLSARAPRRMVIGGDNDQPDLLREACVGAQALVHEATYTRDVAEKVGQGPQHSCALAVAQFAESVAAPNLVLTHFSPRYLDKADDKSASILDIEREAASAYSGSLFLARDFEVYQLDKEGRLHRSGDVVVDI